MGGFEDPRFYTFNQVKLFGKSLVKKGSTGTHIVKWLFQQVEKASTTDQGEEETKTVTVPRIRTYVVFNHSQIEWDADCQPKPLVEKAPIDTNLGFEAAAALLETHKPKLSHGHAQASYTPTLDSIQMPAAEAFDEASGYWATLLHELGHWTGHKSRCNRLLKGRFGSGAYAAEELIAEIASTFLCSTLGVQGELQHPQYIGSWIKVLKDDKYAIFTAAKKATQAVEFLTGAAEAQQAA